jgi:hypothetical protein
MGDCIGVRRKRYGAQMPGATSIPGHGPTGGLIDQQSACF